MATLAIGRRAAGRPWHMLPHLTYMGAMCAFFCASYALANWAAAQRGFVPSAVFAWERNIPFVPWMVMPYWSIDLFYCASFFVCRTRGELTRHTRQLLAAQLISVSCFVLAPLRFSFTRPEVHGLFGAMFEILDRFDGPFNQAPSLHLSLAVILCARYSAHLHGVSRGLVRGWFVLVGIAALTTCQHHFIDVPTGIWVGLFCLALFPENDDPVRPGPAYLAGSAILVLAAVAIGGWALCLLWPAASCLITGFIYGRGDGTLFRKDRVLMNLLLAPYIAGVWLSTRWVTRGEPVAHEIADGVWVGRIPSRAEITGFHSVVDLSAELPFPAECPNYRSVPLLDVSVPGADQLRRAAACIESLHELRPTLVCCAMGYSRSAAAVAGWLVNTRRAPAVDQAIAMIERRRQVVLSPAHRARLRELSGEPEMPGDEPLMARALCAVARCIAGAKGNWAGCAPIERQRIYVANHTSHVDFVLLWSALPPRIRRNTRPVAAAEYWKRGRLRRYFSEHVFDAVLVDRAHIARGCNPLAPMLNALDSGKSLILFPEGTRGDGQQVEPFRCGIYLLARARPDVEIVPVWIGEAHRVLPRGAVVPVPLLCSVTFGAPTHLRTAEDKTEFLARLQAAVCDLGVVACNSTASCF